MSITTTNIELSRAHPGRYLQSVSVARSRRSVNHVVDRSRISSPGLAKSSLVGGVVAGERVSISTHLRQNGHELLLCRIGGTPYHLTQRHQDMLEDDVASSLMLKNV